MSEGGLKGSFVSGRFGAGDAAQQAAARALARLGAGESQVREAMTAVLAETGPDRPA